MKHFLITVLLGLVWISPCGGEPTKAAAPSPSPSAASKPGDKAAAARAREKASADIVFTPSFFEDSARNKETFGKDIFFPNTQRFKAETQENNPNGKPAQDTASLIVKNLVLKGISGAGARRLALLNNRTLGVGEVWDFKLNGQVHRIKCEEIRPHSVLLNIQGVVERQEIQLKTSL
ncbi:MAG: hypothetical protein HYR88_18635 [Verrucomicrobia bacterium]|nr:hypothetical protein [Verrucomicrobiota bacterium]MBI3870788.1 hypothetical protein [Verrucomicrobiota bacterium]